MSEKIKVAAAQLTPVFLDTEATLAKACSAITEAGAHGAQLVAFPETFLPGYPYWAFALPPTEINPYLKRLYSQSVEIPSETSRALCLAAREAGCAVVMGLSERQGGTLYNSQLFIDGGGQVLGTRRKLVPTSFERMLWGRGDGSDLQVFKTDLGILGGLICYEHSNALFRYALQAQGEQLHVANWPGGIPSIQRIVDAAVRHYAFEGQAFVINVTSLLTPEVLDTLPADLARELRPAGGYSAILSPRGDFLAGPKEEGEGLIYAELDFGQIDSMKSMVDCAGHYARPDVVQLRLNPGRQKPLAITNPNAQDK